MEIVHKNVYHVVMQKWYPTEVIKEGCVYHFKRLDHLHII